MLPVSWLFYLLYILLTSFLLRYKIILEADDESAKHVSQKLNPFSTNVTREFGKLPTNIRRLLLRHQQLI